MSNTMEIQNKPEHRHRYGVHPYLLALAAVILGGGSALIGYSVGRQQGMTAVGASADQVETLRKNLRTQTEAVSTLSQTLTTVTQERDLAVDQNRQLTATVNSLREVQKLAAERQGSLMGWAAQNGGVALDVRSIDIRPLPEQAFEYHIDLMSVQPGLRTVTGNLALYLIQGETLLEVPVSPSRFSVNGFQQLVGRWTMPKGVAPQYVEVRVQAGSQSLARRFAWEHGEVIRDMPDTLAEIAEPTDASLTPAGNDRRALTPQDQKSKRVNGDHSALQLDSQKQSLSKDGQSKKTTSAESVRTKQVPKKTSEKSAQTAPESTMDKASNAQSQRQGTADGHAAE